MPSVLLLILISNGIRAAAPSLAQRAIKGCPRTEDLPLVSREFLAHRGN
jgi:hypothetical protein